MAFRDVGPPEIAAAAASGAYTGQIVFRRCENCGERNLVKDGDFTCAICDAPLPRGWNFG